MRRWVFVLCLMVGCTATADPVPADPIERGAALVDDLGCAVCHVGGSQLGPDLAGIWGQPRLDIAGTQLVVDADYIRSSIVFPNQVIVGGYRGRMPPYSISDAEIADIAAYVESLSAPSGTSS